MYFAEIVLKTLCLWITTLEVCAQCSHGDRHEQRVSENIWTMEMCALVMYMETIQLTIYSYVPLFNWSYVITHQISAY